MSQVHVQREGEVAVVVLDDAARKNAMTPELGEAFAKTCALLARDASVRAVVITGAGGAFSGGGDLGMLERLRAVPAEESERFMLAFYRLYLAVLDLPVPTIAAVHGAAIGAGLCVALACDLGVVGVDTKLALNFVNLGLHPGMGATYLVPQRVGAQRARELLLSGRRFDGAEAQRMGMFLEALPETEVLERAKQMAASMAANGPAAVRALKQNLALDRDALEAALAREAKAQSHSYVGAELGEGLSAARERRRPIFAAS